MNLSLIWPFEQKLVSIVWIEFNTASGNYVVQKGSAPFVATLVPYSNIVYCLITGKQETYEIKNKSLISVDRNNVSIIHSA